MPLALAPGKGSMYKAGGHYKWPTDFVNQEESLGKEPSIPKFNSCTGQELVPAPSLTVEISSSSKMKRPSLYFWSSSNATSYFHPTRSWQTTQ